MQGDAKRPEQVIWRSSTGGFVQGLWGLEECGSVGGVALVGRYGLEKEAGL